MVYFFHELSQYETKNVSVVGAAGQRSPLGLAGMAEDAELAGLEDKPGDTEEVSELKLRARYYCDYAHWFSEQMQQCNCGKLCTLDVHTVGAVKHVSDVLVACEHCCHFQHAIFFHKECCRAAHRIP